MIYFEIEGNISVNKQWQRVWFLIVGMHETYEQPLILPFYQHTTHKNKPFLNCVNTLTFRKPTEFVFEIVEGLKALLPPSFMFEIRGGYVKIKRLPITAPQSTFKVA